MRKTLIFMFIVIIALLYLTTTVQAEGNVAKVGETEYATLELAYEAVTTIGPK